MLKQHARLVDFGVRLVDLLLLTFALPLAHQAYATAPMARWHAPPIETLWVAMIAVLILWTATSGSIAVYGAYRTQRVSTEIGRIARAVLVVGLISLACLFAIDSQMPRLLVCFYFVFAFLVLATSRLVIRMLAHTLRLRGFNTRTYAIVGAGPAAERIAHTFSTHPHWGIRLAGFIRTDEDERAPAGAPTLGTLEDLEGILDGNVLDEIVFAVPRERLEEVGPAIQLCEEQGVAVAVPLDPLRIGSGRMSVLELADLSMLVFSRTPSNVMALVAKRAFDVLVSATFLILLAPLFVLVALAIKLESRGPVFFRQTRVGLNGRPFTMVKFRSMYIDAEERLQALRAFNEMSGPVFKMKNDPRITRVGRWLRKTSIDELPQFFNVLTGTMSVVGPRPPIPAEVRAYQRWQRRRLSVRPGITCTWQVSGRNAISFERWMELDLEYIDNWSLRRDFQIFLKTIPAVLSARGAS